MVLPRDFTSITLLHIVSLLMLVSQGHSQSITSLDCTFENATLDPFCGFSQATDDDFDWINHRGSTGTQNTGPAVDHTYGNNEGHYIYTETSRPRTMGQVARLTSPIMSSMTAPRCFSFFYQLNGADVGRLRILLLPVNSTDDPTLLKEWSGDQGDLWLKAGITIDPQTDPHQIIFESVVGEGYRGDIAIDDVQLLNKICPLENIMCGFESRDICGFTQDRTDDFDLQRNSGNTGTWGTGPGIDNTYKNESGYYMFIEANQGQKGHTARLISPLLAGHGGLPSCLIFYYHMYGNMMGDLNVYIKNVTSDDIGEPVWSLSGNRGNKWRAAEYEITTPHDFQVIFEAERGESIQGDIAFDDVNVTFAACPGHHIIRNVSDVTCDFEEAEICYYTQDKDDQFDWTWRNRGTSWRFTGPSVDHTLGNELGFFIYIEASWATPRNAKARISSPQVSAQRRASCLEFWYHMYGKDVEKLNVYVKHPNGLLPDTPLWTQSGDHGDAWHRATVTINMVNQPFKVVFEGARGLFFRDDIAIDDVRLFRGTQCPDYPTQPPAVTSTPTPLSTFRCDFEQDLCDFTQAIGDSFDWVRHRGTFTWRWWFDSVQKDHTLGTTSGYYMIMQSGSWYEQRVGDNAITLSPLLRGSSQPRCLVFWYILHGVRPDFFNIYIKKHGDTLPFDPVLSFYGEMGIDWRQAFLDLPPSDAPFYVVFEGTLASWYPQELAVDDLELRGGVCSQTAPPPLPMSADCDFEGAGDRLCNYTQIPPDNRFFWRRPKTFLWQLNAGPTSTNQTGPPTDHTFGNNTGHYIYMEASQPQRPGDKARITSPVLASRGQKICLQFYYYMNGSQMGSLAVFWSAKNFPEKELLRVKKLSNRWLPVYLEIQEAVDEYQITFEGTVGIGSRGDIAVDDIRFLPQPCSGFEPESQCGFDNGYEPCNYWQDDNDVMEWIGFDGKGLDPSPLGNNSTPVGSFLYIKGDTKSPSNMAVLRPPLITGKGLDHCLSMDVTVRNDPLMRLEVAVEYLVGSWRTLLTINTTTASDWTRVYQKLALDIIKEDPFQLKFTTYFGSNLEEGIIAIDNVTVSQASCDVVKASAKLTGGNGGGGGGGSRANVALGVILALVLIGVVIMLVVAWYFVRRSSGFGDSPLAIKYKNKDENINPVSLSGEPGIANPVYEKSGLEHNA